MRRLLVLHPFALACAPGTNAGTSPSRIAPPAEASDAATVEEASADVGTDVGPAALTADAPILALTVGAITGYVALPIGATSPRPIVVGVHGAEDHADWSCYEWAATLAAYAWVVCPQGPAFRTGFVWSSAEQIYERAMALVAEVERRWPEWVAEGPMVYGGWSQGAMLAPTVIASHPGTFDRAVLVEAGYTPMNGDASVGALAKGGVRRVLVSCSSTPCRTLSKSMVDAGPKHGVDVATNDVGLRGHWFDAPVFESLGEKWPSLVSGDPRWAGYRAPSQR